MKEETPLPAEAATELGQDEPNFYSSQYMLEELGTMVIGCLWIFAIVAFIATLVGYFTR